MSVEGSPDAAVGGGAGRAAGPPGPAPGPPARVTLRVAPAPGAAGEDTARGAREGAPADLLPGRDRRYAVGYQADVQRRSAHVERDKLAHSVFGAQRDRACDACGRAG